MKRMMVVVLGGVLLLGYQNCSKVSVADVNAAVDAANLGSSGGSGSPSNPVVACDPFSTTATACDANTTAGLLGDIYYLQNGQGVQTYIDHGQKLNLSILMSQLNIPTRDWLDGFPSSSGDLLKEDDGTVLNEWFALDLKGKIQLPAAMSEGAYQFALMSDDGSILDIDGQTIVDNDGTHASQWKCGAIVNLKHGERHDIRVRYYQGPRVQIALELLMRPASMQGSSCDKNGGFQIVPAEAFSH